MQHLTLQEAEELAGKKLDARRRWVLWADEVCRIEAVTNYCNGCLEIGDYGGGLENYPYDSKAKCHVGSGCHECGYTGKRRYSYPVPHWADESRERA